MAKMLYVRQLITEKYACVQMVIREMLLGCVLHMNVQRTKIVNLTKNAALMVSVEIHV